MRGPGAATTTLRASTRSPPSSSSAKPVARARQLVAPRRVVRSEGASRRATSASHQLREPAAQRVEGGRPGAAVGALRPRRRPRAAHQAAVGLLEVAEARERGEDREPLRVARVNPREQRLAEPLDRLLAEAAAQEGRDRLVVVSVAAGPHEIEAHPQLAGPGEEAAPEQGQDLRGHREHHPVGQRVQLRSGGARRPPAAPGSSARAARRARARGRARSPAASAPASSRARPRAGSRRASRSGSLRRSGRSPRAADRDVPASGPRAPRRGRRCRHR